MIIYVTKETFTIIQVLFNIYGMILQITSDERKFVITLEDETGSARITFWENNECEAAKTIGT